MIISIDFETRGTLDLRQVGAYRYSEHPDTDVWCMAWAVDDEPVELWVPGESYPFAKLDGWADLRLSAWNAGFERAIWAGIMEKRYGWPEMPLEMWDDTAAAAAVLSLPRSLEKAAEVLVNAKKDMAGHRLMMQMARPRSEDPLVWWDVPHKKEALYAYCKQDVEVERAIRKKVWPAFTEEEQEVWRLDQRMNDRGLLVDVRSARGARGIVKKLEARLNSEMQIATNGMVSAVTNAGELLDFVKYKGVNTNTVKAEWVDANVDNEKLLPCVRHALKIRQEGGKASVAKLERFISVASSFDHRARGLLYYYGADTGRWAGRLIQPHNMPRGEVKLDPDDEVLYELLARQDMNTLDLLYPGNVMEIISAALRGIFKADPEHDFIGVDYSAIEAVVLAWLAGEERMLEIFRTHGLVYEDMATQIFNVGLEAVTKGQRSHGKVGVLGCGYQMGGKTLQGYAEGMGVIMTEEEAQAIVDGYRARNPNIVSFWAELNEAALLAVHNPGRVVPCRKVAFETRGWFLWMHLPSGRKLAYANPSIEGRAMPWDANDIRPAVKIWHVNSFTHKWTHRFMYGGLLAENATQAVARDVMVEGMFALERSRLYTPVLTVHDEILSEVPQGEGSVDDAVRLMTSLPEWGAGLPISAAGWRGHRYRKD